MYKRKIKRTIKAYMYSILILVLLFILLIGSAILSNRFRNTSWNYDKAKTESNATENNISETNTLEANTIDTENIESLIDMSAQYPYKLTVNRVQNRVVVYGIDYDGNYTVPYKGFICSTGAKIDDTPLGTFSISDKYDWREMVDGSYAQYATRVHNGILFHSVPYFSPKKDDLETEEYNKLGSAASLGCIRLAVCDIKWIYDNCPKGTTVVIYDDEDEVFPVTFTEPIKIPENSPYSGWDPTDPDENNPWNNASIN